MVPAAHHLMIIKELQAVADGRTRRLMIFLPPGSAKSTYASKLFPAWMFAQRNDLKIIGASHTASLAEKFSREIMGYARDHADLLGYTLERESVELWSASGGREYKAVGVGGAIAGFRADLVVLDDPVKSRADAESEVIREKTWEWFTGDLRTRLKPDAPVVLINTRWHPDDLSGRLLETQKDQWRVVSLPATAVEGDPLGRAPGEMLWTDDAYGYGAELVRVRAEYEAQGAMRDWWSLYEQSPRPVGGSLFKAAMLTILPAAPLGGKLVRAWDLAATAASGTRNPDWTVGVKMARLPDGRFVVLDVVRFRGPPEEVEAAIANVAAADGRSVRIGLPQDPGQAGKMQVAYLAKRLAGYRIDSSPETGDKATRADPFVSQVNVGNVSLVQAPWTAAYVDELAGFPGAAKDDQVDASSRAFGMLVEQPARPRTGRGLALMGNF